MKTALKSLARGCRITAIMPASQAGDGGSTPLTRSKQVLPAEGGKVLFGRDWG